MLGPLLVFDIDSMNEPGPPSDDPKFPVAPHHICLAKGFDRLRCYTPLSNEPINESHPTVLGGTNSPNQLVLLPLNIHSICFIVALL